SLANPVLDSAHRRKVSDLAEIALDELIVAALAYRRRCDDHSTAQEVDRHVITPSAYQSRLAIVPVIEEEFARRGSDDDFSVTVTLDGSINLPLVSDVDVQDSDLGSAVKLIDPKRYAVAVGKLRFRCQFATQLRADFRPPHQWPFVRHFHWKGGDALFKITRLPLSEDAHQGRPSSVGVMRTGGSGAISGAAPLARTSVGFSSSSGAPSSFARPRFLKPTPCAAISSPAVSPIDRT